MAGRLSRVMASRVFGGGGLIGRSTPSAASLARSGMGLPVGRHIVPDRPVSITQALPAIVVLLNMSITPTDLALISRVITNNFFLPTGIQLPTSDELTWDNGTDMPEPCVDRLAPNVGKYEALAWLCGGLGFLASVGLLAVWNDKASKIPYTPKVFPYDNLRIELGGDPEQA